jgi:hypothetical protein
LDAIQANPATSTTAPKHMSLPQQNPELASASKLDISGVGMLA